MILHVLADMGRFYAYLYAGLIVFWAVGSVLIFTIDQIDHGLTVIVKENDNG